MVNCALRGAGNHHDSKLRGSSKHLSFAWLNEINGAGTHHDSKLSGSSKHLSFACLNAIYGAGSHHDSKLRGSSKHLSFAWLIAPFVELGPTMMRSFVDLRSTFLLHGYLSPSWSWEPP